MPPKRTTRATATASVLHRPGLAPLPSSRAAWKRQPAIALTIVSLVWVGSCGIKPKPLPTPRRVIEADEPANPFAPVGVRIHPLTRLVSGARDDPATIIDAHFELIDQAGDSVKGAGLLTIELYRGTGAVSALGEQDQVMRWVLDLTNIEANRLAYDRVTRTYRVRLTGIPDTLRAGGETGLSLQVRLTTPGGRQFRNEAKLGW